MNSNLKHITIIYEQIIIIAKFILFSNTNSCILCQTVFKQFLINIILPSL